MNKFAPSLAALGMTMAAYLPAQVLAAPITWVAETGSDAGPCNNPSPCKSLGKALSLTDPAGEVRILGQGSFDGVVIQKAVSIISDTSQGGVLAKPATTAILIQAGAADVIHLRGLMIEGAGTGLDGIRFESGAALHIQNSVIRGFQSGTLRSNYGIRFIPSSTASLFVSDTLIANNGAVLPDPAARAGAALPRTGGGILITPVAGMAAVSLDRVHLEKNIFGIGASGAAGSFAVSVWDSVIAGNLDTGIVAKDAGTIVLERSAVVNNGDAGVQADGALATVYVGNSAISGNGTGFRAVNGGVLQLQANNTIVANKLAPVEAADSQ